MTTLKYNPLTGTWRTVATETILVEALIEKDGLDTIVARNTANSWLKSLKNEPDGVYAFPGNTFNMEVNKRTGV